MDRDEEFNLDDDVDLESPLLDGMLSDRKLARDPDTVGVSMATAAHTETGNLEPTEDDWENM